MFPLIALSTADAEAARELDKSAAVPVSAPELRRFCQMSWALDVMADSQLRSPSASVILVSPKWNRVHRCSLSQITFRKAEELDGWHAVFGKA